MHEARKENTNLEFLALLLLGEALLARLRLHLLDVDGVRLAAAHVQLVVAHAEGEDALVDADARREEDEVRRLLVDRLDDELAVRERDVADFGPREADLGCQLVVLLVDVQSERVHAQPQLGALLVADLKVVDAVHFEVLRDFQVLHH
jgi:hypothetical protein